MARDPSLGGRHLEVKQEAQPRAKLAAERKVQHHPEFKGKRHKARTHAGWPVLIRADGTYEVFNWDAALPYTWNESAVSLEPRKETTRAGHLARDAGRRLGCQHGCRQM